MESELYKKWYKCFCENEIISEAAQIAATLVSYHAGEITISNTVKEKLIELEIMNKDGKINISESNIYEWLRIATLLHLHYRENNYTL